MVMAGRLLQQPLVLSDPEESVAGDFLPLEVSDSHEGEINKYSIDAVINQRAEYDFE